MDVAVKGVILDASVLLQDSEDDEKSPVFRPGAESLLRKLRHSIIRTGISIGSSLSPHKVDILKRTAMLYSVNYFTVDPSSLNDAIHGISLGWGDMHDRIMFVVSHNLGVAFSKLVNFGWKVVFLDGEGSINSCLISGATSIKKLEELPLTIFRMNAVDNDAKKVGYIMKPSREEDFAKRGAFPLYPCKSGLIFVPLTFELPLSSQLQEVDGVLHKATDEIVSIELTNSPDLPNRVEYSTGLQEFQRGPCPLTSPSMARFKEIENNVGRSTVECPALILLFLRLIPRWYIEQHPQCCVIDPLDDIYPVVDRLEIQKILLGLENLKTESDCIIRGPRFLKVDKFNEPDLAERLSAANLSLPCIVKPQVACGLADAHSMASVVVSKAFGACLPSSVLELVMPTCKAIVFNIEDFQDLGVPLPAIIQEYVDHSSTLFKFYVLGDKVFHAVKKSTPNINILKLSTNEELKPLVFDSLKSLPVNNDNKKCRNNDCSDDSNKRIDIGLVTDAANWLVRILNLTIIGFDVVIEEGSGDHVIVDLNYLPSFKEVPNDIAIPAFWNAIKKKLESAKN